MNDHTRDRGAALLIVLAITVVLSVVVVSITNYVAADLSYGRVTADRAARLASADAVMNYAVDQLKLRNASCLLGGSGPVALPGLAANLNGATTTVSCQRVGGGIGDIQAWAAVMTGVGLSPSDYLLSTQSGNSIDKTLGGPVYMTNAQPSAFNLGPNVTIKDGPLYNYDPTCNTPVTPGSLPPQLQFVPNLIYGPICTTVPWYTLFGDPTVPDLTATATFPLQSGESFVLNGTCRVFSPGVYTEMPDLGNNAYFKSGDYYFLNVTFDVVSSTVTAGYSDPAGPAPRELPNTPCDAAHDADVQPPATAGATFYLGGSSHIIIEQNGTMEIGLRKHGTNYVSVHALCDTINPVSAQWCDQTGVVGTPSTLTATSSDPIVFTKEGNGKQMITHGLIYAPSGRMEFGNATSTAYQKMEGGLIVARLVLQSSASASNFSIAVATSPIDVTVLLTATATKNGTTTIRSVIDYRPFQADIKLRLAITSWRVL